MCGIVGAVTQRNVSSILLEGLKRLEYRGYDSAGMAVIDTTGLGIQRIRVLGKVAKLADELTNNPLKGTIGIAHTRWATHGQPSTTNAHPHLSANEIAIVHNGIIENYDLLRQRLKTQGYQFLSETDTEVVAHLIHYHLQNVKDMQQAIYLTTQDLQGAYALGILSLRHPQSLYAIRRGSPLVVGLGIEEHFIASDPHALTPVTQRFIYLEEGDIAKMEYHTLEIRNDRNEPTKRKIHTIDIHLDNTSKGQYRHYMQKEIFEQPTSLANTLEGYIINNRVTEQCFGHKSADIFEHVKRIHIIACGTSYHAALVAKNWFEEMAGISCQVDIASEYRYRCVIVEPDTLFVAISQSGETADTLAAFHSAKKLGYLATLAICNVPQSTLVRETDLVFLTRAGIEIGVAATKTFTTQLEALLMLAIVLGQKNKVSPDRLQKLTQELSQLPNLIREILTIDQPIKEISNQFIRKQHVLFLGRGVHYPIALEGALKLKEISYLHAEAYPAGELKHGPLALIDKEIPVIVLAPRNHLFDKLVSNLEEVRARGGELFIFTDELNHWKPDEHLTLIQMPKIPESLSPIAYTIPMQLLAYHIAVLKGTDVDQPRNLAKSVTVE